MRVMNVSPTKWTVRYVCGMSDGRRRQHATRAAELCHQAYKFLQQNKKTHKNVSTILQDCAIARIGLHLLLNRASPKLQKKSADETISAGRMKKNRRFQG